MFNSSSAEIVPEEIEANQFAVELLMPESLLSEALLKRRNETDVVGTLAADFGVSNQAMSIRLSALGFLNPAYEEPESQVGSS